MSSSVTVPAPLAGKALCAVLRIAVTLPLLAEWFSATAATSPGNQHSELPAASTPDPAARGLVLTNADHTIQFSLATNACPQAPWILNTFDLVAHGETILQSPRRNLPAVGGADDLFGQILINGRGPAMTCENSLTLVEQACGPEWRAAILDATAGYRDRLTTLRRTVVVVDPDLIVIYDRMAAPEPVTYAMRLHPPSGTRVDPDWGDLRLALDRAALIVHAPGRKRDPRPWQRVDSPADALWPGTVTMHLGPTNRVSQLHVLTVLAISPSARPVDYTFRLIESTAAIGAQIQRNGLPTLVAFRTDPQAPGATLNGFPFQGPVGVYVFKPKTRAGRP